MSREPNVSGFFVFGENINRIKISDSDMFNNLLLRSIIALFIFRNVVNYGYVELNQREVLTCQQ